MEHVSLDEQLRILSECGVRLIPGVTLDDLFVHGERSDFEANPFEFLLGAMGSECGPAFSKQGSNDVWAFDDECIEGDGSYVEIARCIAGLAPDALPLEEVRDSVDHDTGEAWLEFRLGEEQHRWEFPVEDDFVDVQVFYRFDELLARRDLRLIMYKELILVGTSQKLALLQEHTGLSLRWLTQPLTS